MEKEFYAKPFHEKFILTEPGELAYRSEKYLKEDINESLAKAQFEDVPKNIWFRKYGFIVAVFVVIVMLLTWLLPTCNKN